MEPRWEGIRARGYEILLLEDHVDLSAMYRLERLQPLELYPGGFDRDDVEELARQGYHPYDDQAGEILAIMEDPREWGFDPYADFDQ